MLASATHDHKRGEDVRARLAVLSEYASEWAEMLPRWIARCEPLRRDAAPHPSDIAILLQMIVGAWPPDLAAADREGCTRFARRLAQWQEKALREAKLHTDWAVPNEAYETAAHELLRSLIERNECRALLIDIAGFAARIAPAGALNGLAQTLLKLAAPGVPDIYQGTELWDFSLVDPDNRQPVDFAARSAALDDSAPASRTAHWHDGRIKQALIARTLALRTARPKLFAEGSYEPLEVRGACADNIVAFARRHESDVVLVVVPRIASRLLLPQGSLSFDPGAWKDTAISLPQQIDFADALSGEPVSPEGAIARTSSLFARFPVALLVSSRTR
jgi:(1->4)-alpha-D-glucan 1-alpha-D-glucosylmutase